MKLCVYAICKNEITNIQRWLDAVKEADEVVVLDTGSTDGTWEILQKSSVKCYQKIINPWRFDVARNYALSLVPKDCEICVPLDIDMFAIKGFSNIIKDAWEKELGILSYDSLFVNTGKMGNWLAHNRKAAWWVYPVYEQIRAIGNKKIITRTLIHNEWVNKESHRGYLPLIELALSENPQNGYLMSAKQQILRDIKRLEELKNV